MPGRGIMWLNRRYYVFWLGGPPTRLGTNWGWTAKPIDLSITGGTYGGEMEENVLYCAVSGLRTVHDCTSGARLNQGTCFIYGTNMGGGEKNPPRAAGGEGTSALACAVGSYHAGNTGGLVSVGGM